METAELEVELGVVVADLVLGELIIPFSRRRLDEGGVTLYEVVDSLGMDERAEQFLKRYEQLKVLMGMAKRSVDLG
ncbi:MAG: hypothetical protein WAW92_02380 [Minisyncoccia bacterium]